jgi:Outer membrane protein beta-barrel domain
MAKVKKLIQFSMFCLFCFSTNVGKAQIDEDEDLRTFFGGVMLGLNASQISSDGIEGYHKYGLNFGAMTYIKLDENVALSMEMLYNEKGSYYWPGVDPQLANGKGKFYKKYTIILPYAEIPVLVNIFDKRKSNAGIGLSYGRLFNEKEILDSADLSKAFPFKKSDVNLILNGTLMINNHFGVNLRFNYSMLNIREKHNIDLLHREQQFSRLFTIRGMYLF